MGKSDTNHFGFNEFFARRRQLVVYHAYSNFVRFKETADMKAVSIIGALCVALCAQVAHSQSTVTINVPGTAGCQITGITALTASAGNVFTASGGTAVGCGGTQQTGPTPTVNISPSQQSYTLGSANGAPQLSWSATNAVSCNTARTGATIFNTFNFSTADGSPWPRSSTELAKEICTSASNCGGVVTATPTATAAAGSYSVSVTCTGSTGLQTTTAAAITLAAPVNNPPPTNCDSSLHADITQFPLTRSCTGNVSFSWDALPYANGDLTLTDHVFGQWPLDAFGGQATIMSIGKNNFISMKFTVTTANTVKLGANVSWGGGGTVSVSNTPGIFVPGNKDYICGGSGGSSSLIISSNGWNGASCNLNIGQSYYLNFTNYFNGALQCRAASGMCNVAYTSLLTN